MNRRRVLWKAPLGLTHARSTPLNQSQHAALDGLKWDVELICGPPATGKSTTIHALAIECVEPDDVVLICAVQNRAIEALADKFKATGTAFVTIGRGVIGTAAEYTLEQQLERNLNAYPEVVAAREALQAAIEEYAETQGPETQGLVSAARARVQTAEFKAYCDISGKAKALLCTTASVAGATHDLRLAELFKSVRTACIDEAGSTTDRHVLMIIECCDDVQKLALMGDTRQLPVFTTLSDKDAGISLLMRLEQQIESIMLTLQYRMPLSLAAVVSHCFYGGRLLSGFTTPRPDFDDPNALRFIRVAGEATPERNGTSMVNEMEAKATADAANSLARLSRTQRVVVLCVYKAQMRRVRELLMEANAEALTVDSAQGREWDHVILTLVSSDPKRLGFVRDRRRQCVALSRAMRTMTLVAHPDVVKELPAMKVLCKAAEGVLPSTSGITSGSKRKRDTSPASHGGASSTVKSPCGMTNFCTSCGTKRAGPFCGRCGKQFDGTECGRGPGMGRGKGEGEGKGKGNEKGKSRGSGRGKGKGKGKGKGNGNKKGK